MIFVNSMSDLFHKDIPRAHISAVFDTMEAADWHIYQILTKRSSLLQKFINERYRGPQGPAHMWFGVSVENEQATSGSRICKSRTPAFASFPWSRLSLLSASCPRWHSLGNCRRRKRASRAAYEAGMGHRYSEPMRRRARSFLFQTMGRALTGNRTQGLTARNGTSFRQSAAASKQLEMQVGAHD